MLSSKRSQRGFTLIELLIVVAIIGILAAIAIPNLLAALQRAKQKRTMSDMREIATAWEARAGDVSGYTAAGYTVLATQQTVAAVNGRLSPTYIRSLPKNDGWGAAWQFYTNSSTNAHQYQIISTGKDLTLSTDSPEGPTTNYDCDIVYSGGAFVVYPEGAQTGS